MRGIQLIKIKFIYFCELFFAILIAIPSYYVIDLSVIRCIMIFIDLSNICFYFPRLKGAESEAIPDMVTEAINEVQLQIESDQEARSLSGGNLLYFTYSICGSGDYSR